MSFEDYLKSLDFDRLVQLWNEYCWGENGCAENAIYDSIDQLSADGLCTGIELTRAVFFGDVRGWNDRVSFNGYGNLYSVYDYDSSPIDINYLAEWLKDEDHEVYQEWMDENNLGEFPEWLAANNIVDDLHKLWVEYRGEPICGFTVDQVFNIDVLAQSLAEADHKLFRDWLSEQEDDEYALLEEQSDEV